MKNMKVLILMLIISITSLFLSAVSVASAYVEEHDGMYEVYYDDGEPEAYVWWTWYGQKNMGFAVRFTPPFSPCYVVAAYFCIEGVYEFTLAVYDDAHKEIYRQEVKPAEDGWVYVTFSEPVWVHGDFYIAMLLKTPAHPGLWVDETPPYHHRSYWISDEGWKAHDEVCDEEGWDYGDFCITAFIEPADTDEDGLYDHEELERGTNMINPDSDGDELLDGEEVKQFNTDPLNPDSDGDGVKDGDEVKLLLDPLDPDVDDDGLMDGHELQKGTNPWKADSDGDGWSDPSDPAPTNALIPNGIAIGGVAAVAAAALTFFTRKRKPTPPTLPPTAPKILKCPRCGAEVPPDAEYCPECGEKLK